MTNLTCCDKAYIRGLVRGGMKVKEIAEEMSMSVSESTKYFLLLRLISLQNQNNLLEDLQNSLGETSERTLGMSRKIDVRH